MHNDGGKRRGEELPYWLVNVSPECWPASCPDYLADADESDRKVLATRDEDYQPMTWDEAASLVSRLKSKCPGALSMR